jgi:Glycosyl hydrolases family 32 N-terminal domain
VPFLPDNKPFRPLSSPWKLIILGFILLIAFLEAGSALALVRLDFEQKYYQHKDRQVWDFSIIRPDSVYHIFYHTIHEVNPAAANGDTIWHGTSKDLKHWDLVGPILVVGPEYWDAGAMWAPDVFYDDATGIWKIAYTGCDVQMNQRICLAESPDLYTWKKVRPNPVLTPDPEVYIWNDSQWWSNFRDPFVYKVNDEWHILVTALQWQTQGTGVLYHGVSRDLIDWTDQGVIFSNDGNVPSNVLESPQYKVVGDYHYLFFGEYDTYGLSVISGLDPQDWTMANRTVFDFGYAPEIDEFDTGHYMVSRLAPYNHPQTDVRSYAVRLDTLEFGPDGTVDGVNSYPLNDNWESWSGIACQANPTFGDNPGFRGEESVGMVGNGYFGSGEYYQGPLSGKGQPGTRLGDVAKGSLNSYPFMVIGDRMDLLVSGGIYPETCFVALMDAGTDTVIYKETGNNQNLMTLRSWNLRPHKGQMCYIRIEDNETGEMGTINVDEIIEVVDTVSSTEHPDVRQVLMAHRAAPNPFNPMTIISFVLDRELEVEIRIHDLRGREIWTSGEVRATTGDNSVTWQGVDTHAQPAPAGTYLYSIEVQGAIAASGKLSLVK